MYESLKSNFSQNTLDYLCCPKCKGDLSFREADLFCGICDITYMHKEGVPILIDLSALPEHLMGQVKYFENESVIKTEYHLEPWQESYVEKFLTHFPSVENKLIIDCGTGSGYMAIELAKRGARVIACDLTLKSLVRLKNAVKNAGVEENVILVCCSAENLPFKDTIANYFISNAVLEHLPNEAGAIKEIQRVCKSDSGVMIAVPLAYRYLNPILLPVNFIHDKRIGHLRRYDERSILKKFSTHVLVQSYYTGHFSKVAKTLCNFLFHIFDEKLIEKADRKGENNKSWASNIICFLKKS